MRPFDQADLTSFSWRCQRLASTGEVDEKTGNQDLAEPIPVDEFAKYSKEEVDALIADNVDMQAVEDSFETE